MKREASCRIEEWAEIKRRKQLEGLAEYRKSVIYAYVTGKKEVAA